MKAISLHLDNAQYERLRFLSFTTRQPMAEIVRAAIDTHLKHASVKPGQEWFWTAEWQAAEREAEADLVAGRVQILESNAAFLDSLVSCGDDTQHRDMMSSECSLQCGDSMRAYKTCHQ